MAMKMEEGAVSQGIWAASRTGKGTEMDSFQAPPEQMQLWGKTRARLLTHRLYNDKFVLFLATKFVVICWSSNKKQIQAPYWKMGF